MFASLERLQRLVSRPAHTYRPTMETFADLDTQRLARELELSKRGQSRGKQNQPTSEATPYDAVEGEVIEHIGAAQKRAHDDLENHMAGFRQRLIDLDFESRFSDIKAASLGGLSDLKQELQAGVDDLHGLRKDLTAAERHSSKFAARHRLDRPARITTSRSTFFKVVLIVVLVGVELLLNGELLSKSSALGLLGGVLEAFIFAALNIGIALLFGVFAIPYLSHRNWLLKLLGLVALAAYLVLMIGLNLSLAHYREVAETLVDGAGTLVMQRLIESPLALIDFRSWLLFGLGVVFSIIALLDAFALRDTYPGYARVDKALRTARAKYADMRRAAIEELGEKRRQYEDLLSTSRSDLSKQRQEHDAIVSHRTRMISLFGDYQVQLEKAANLLIRTYRDANAASRSTQSPAYFADPYRLSQVPVSISKEGEWNSSELRGQITAAQEEIDQIFIQLGKQFDEALVKYRELDDIAPDAT